MKSKLIFAGSLLAAALLGGSVSALIVKGSSDKSDRGTEMSQRMPDYANVPPHFTNYQKSDYPDLTYAAENAVQAVVNIEVTQQVAARQGGRDPFFEFFGIPQGYYDDGRPREQKSGGSGVIISPDGYIVTNHHVVENATKLKVKLYDQRTFEATLIGTDPTSEVALIKIDAKELPWLPFGSSDNLRLGEWVLAIGSPFDLQHTITAGIVSAKARNLGAISSNYRVESFIQTDAAVNPGNSGGALVNTNGELVGINTLIKSQTGTYMGYSFAIPSSIVQKVVADLREYGIVQRALLGIQYQEINDDFLEAFGEKYGITEKGGIYVAGVDPEGAAHAAGIKEGDVLVSINGISLETNPNLSEIMSRYRPNDKINISAKRGGKLKQFDVVLRNKAGKAELLGKDYVDVVAELGGRFADINDRTKRELNIDHGVRVSEVRSGGLLARANVKQGFIITSINERPVRSVSDLEKITSKVTLIEGVYPNGRSISYSIVQ